MKKSELPPKPKRVRGHCVECGGPVAGYKSCRCAKCYLSPQVSAFAARTLASFRGPRNSWAKHRYQAIRENAKVVLSKAQVPRECARCGYSKHVEVCHVRSIGDFPDSATVSKVNNLKNLIYLCPNHHWEHDNLRK